MFGEELGQALRKRRISCGLYLLRAALPVCRRQRPLGRQAGGGGSWRSLSLPGLLSLFLSLTMEGGRLPARCSLLWPSIMHDTIDNLLSFFYHLQGMNNVILHSCFLSICRCVLSSYGCKDLTDSSLCLFSPECIYVSKEVWNLANRQNYKPFICEHSVI